MGELGRRVCEVEQRPGFGTYARLFVVALAVAWGLGYPVLNRYDPRQVGNSDATTYYALVEGKGDTVAGFQKSRVLTPALARPIFLVVRGHVGSWNPAAFALLFVNALFVAGAAVLLVLLGQRAGVPVPTSTTAAFLYLGAFPVVNGHLAGLVDASETTIMSLLALALFERRYLWAVACVGVGATSKETVGPLAAAFAAGWILFDEEGGLRRAVGLTGIIGFVGIGAALLVRSFVERRIVLPWTTVAEMARPLSLTESVRGLLAPQWIYAFAAFVPLGLRGLRGLPRKWIAAAGFASAVAVGLGIYADSGGNASRPVFNVAGSLLALATARVLSGRAQRKHGRAVEGVAE